MSGPKNCASCGQPNSADARFCGRCGAVMAPGAAPIASPPAPARPVSTMLAGSMDELPGAPGRSAPAPGSGAKTMFGASFDPPAKAAAPEPARTVVDQPLAPPEPKKREPMRTMLGVAIDPRQLPASPFATSPGTQNTPAPPRGALQSAFASHPPPAPQPAAPSGYEPTTQMAAMPEAGAFPSAPSSAWHEPAPPSVDHAAEERAAAEQRLAAERAAAEQHAAQARAAERAAAEAQAAAERAAAEQRAAAERAEQEQRAALHQAEQQRAAAELQRAAQEAEQQRVAAEQAAAQAAAAQAPAAAGPAVPRSNRTMLGMPAAIDVDAIAAAAAAAREQSQHHRPKPTERGIPAAPKDAPAPEPAATKKRLGPSNRTMLGVAVQTGAPSTAQAEAAPQPAPSAAYAQHAPTPNAYAPSAGHSPEPVDYSIAGLPSPAKRGRGLLMAVLVFGLLLVAGVAAALLWYRFGRGPGLHVAVAQGEEGEVLSVDVPDAAPGTRVRFGGQEQELAAGHAQLPLSVDALHVGDNVLSIDVVSPGGGVDTRSVTLTVELRVRADLTSLSAEPAAITVIVEALPGSVATLDGAPLTLDAAGRGTRAFPLAALAAAPATPEAAAAPLVHTVAYTVTPPGQAAASGTLTTRVPRTSLQIDRPGAEVVVDQESLEIAGAVAPDTTVRIEGADVPVTEGRFLYRFTMPSVGEFTPSIVARAPGRAPTTRTLRIRRVEDLAREAASFEYDRSLTYARLATGPAHYQGQHVAFEGNVYNVDVQGGLTILQMRARECPRGEQCLLWVTYASAAEVTVGSWVRVLGAVGGEQQFRTESGMVRTVPRIDATYVLPARP